MRLIVERLRQFPVTGTVINMFINADIRLNELSGGSKGETVSQRLRQSNVPILKLFPHFRDQP